LNQENALTLKTAHFLNTLKMKSLTKILMLAAVFTACKNTPAPAPVAPDASAILNHKYWVSKPFNEALFANNIVDTLSNLICSELIFTNKDSLLYTSCLSDAGGGTFKVSDANTLEIMFEGFEGKASKATLDEKTGVLHIVHPEGTDADWPLDFVAQDGIAVNNIDNVTVALARKRLAGNYTYMTKKGEYANTSVSELHLDGTQVNFGDFDTYEPWPSGIGGGAIQNPQLNLMYFIKKGKEAEPMAIAWQLHGDTLRLWDTKNISPKGDMEEYRIKGLRGAYLKVQ
jgi:hypothetical protein